MKSDIVETIIEAVISISIISLVILSIILLIRIVFYILIFIFSKIYSKNLKLKAKKETPKKNTNVVIYKKEEDELLRDQKKEKKQEKEQFTLQGVQRMNDNTNEDMEISDNYEEDVRVVGIVKPIGFWTSLILGDQLSQIIGRAHALNNRSHKGFWVSMLEAQARGLGRQHGRQR